MTEDAGVSPDWSSLLAGAITVPQAQPLIESSAADLDQQLERDGGLEDVMLDLLERRLVKPYDPETYQRAWDIWRGLFGEQAAYYVHWSFMVRDQPEYRQIAESAAPPRARALVRRMLVTFGPELDAAFQIWQELPDAWKALNREVYFDVIRGRPYIKLTLEKLNGEQIMLEGTADSILGLARSMLVTLRWVGNADSFNQGGIDLFLDEAEPLVSMLKREEAPSGDGVVAGELSTSAGHDGDVET
jgi:hypothetical protein